MWGPWTRLMPSSNRLSSCCSSRTPVAQSAISKRLGVGGDVGGVEVGQGFGPGQEAGGVEADGVEAEALELGEIDAERGGVAEDEAGAGLPELAKRALFGLAERLVLGVRQREDQRGGDRLVGDEGRDHLLERLLVEDGGAAQRQVQADRRAGGAGAAGDGDGFVEGQRLDAADQVLAAAARRMKSGASARPPASCIRRGTRS